MTDRKWAIGVDLGGTKTRIAHVDANGQVQQERQFPTAVEAGAAAIEAAIVQAAQELVRLHPIPPAGVGVGIAGQVDETGNVIFAPNLHWHNYPFQTNLSNQLSLNVSITNDVRAATLGEWIFGAGRGCQNLVCLFVGTGIGGGIVSQGQLLTGHGHSAGELGHTIIALDGPPCSCGNRGCLEALAAGWSIRKRARKAVEDNPQEGKRLLELASGQLDALSARQVATAVAEGDPLAIRLMQESIHALAAGCISFVHAFNPQKLLFGGGIIQGMPWIVPQVAQEVRSHVLKAFLPDLEILPAQLGPEAGVIGAATLVF